MTLQNFRTSNASGVNEMPSLVSCDIRDDFVLSPKMDSESSTHWRVESLYMIVNQ